MTFDVHAIRAEFPILARKVHGKPLDLFRQRRFGAEAERRDRRYGQRHAALLRQRASRTAHAGE
jgi:hypothetical protein